MKLTIIDNGLCLIDKMTGQVLKRYQPFSMILEYKRVRPNRIVIREESRNTLHDKPNIYCLDDNLQIVWFACQPFEASYFPNSIEWNKELNDNGTSWADYVIDNPDTLTCSSGAGITYTISYETGEIVKSIFTK